MLNPFSLHSATPAPAPVLAAQMRTPTGARNRDGARHKVAARKKPSNFVLIADS
jgi:hypothetical protein